MNEEYVMDTFAWIEYFLGTERGEKIKEIIEGKRTITPSIVIAELSAKYSNEGKESSNKLKFIRFYSKSVILNNDIAEFAGKIRTEQRKNQKDFGIVDAIIYATALKLKSKIVTGDPHFRNIKEAILI